MTLHLLFGFTEREIREQTLHELDGREALYTLGSARLDGVARALYLVVTKKDGCEYDFGLVSADDESLKAASRDFEAMLAGFSTDR
ncbi:MAG: hypothetical protein R3A47_03075 [Polyangiales bacterium]